MNVRPVIWTMHSYKVFGIGISDLDEIMYYHMPIFCWHACSFLETVQFSHSMVLLFYSYTSCWRNAYG